MIDVCSVDDVPEGEGRPATVDGQRVAIFNAPSGWFALADHCPHRGGPLSDGILADGCVVCPLHDRRFQLEDGAVLNDDDCGPARAFAVEVRDGRVFVELSAAMAEAA